ncbi:hypothetical protein B0H17DRAFT_1215565 [Mycena rosella]|uniref:Uncharacterized protein n=1 Tax=Mycena rosella TaxID=1033263 RepID=A0AAD7CJ84_MYCRO|nr:hypothetical protein B0H17DRAFT_1215565 [Mycena rosella]
MGREQYGITKAKQAALYAAWQKDPFSPEGREFRAPTLDPFIAYARRQVEPGNTQRAVETLLPPRTPSPLMPVFSQVPPTPPMSRASLLALAQHLGQCEMSIPAAPGPVLQNDFQPAYPSIPVLLTDSILYHNIQVPRFAILGPHQTGLLWEGRQIQLVHGDTHTIHLRRNHGLSPQKPWCTVIEAEYEIDGLVYHRILLAAHFLVHDSFRREATPGAQFTGDGPNSTVLDCGRIVVEVRLDVGVKLLNIHNDGCSEDNFLEKGGPE